MGPPATIYHHQLWIKRPARVKVRPFPHLPLLKVLHHLVVGGLVAEVLCIFEVRLRECLGLLVRGSMGHGIEVVQRWHLLLVVMCLKERNNILVKGSS